jgi:hypothetical protein
VGSCIVPCAPLLGVKTYKRELQAAENHTVSLRGKPYMPALCYRCLLSSFGLNAFTRCDSWRFLSALKSSACKHVLELPCQVCFSVPSMQRPFVDRSCLASDYPHVISKRGIISNLSRRDTNPTVFKECFALAFHFEGEAGSSRIQQHSLEVGA